MPNDLLHQMSSRLTRIETLLETKLANHDRRLDDAEESAGRFDNRLRQVEISNAKLAVIAGGGGTIGGAIVTAIIALAQNVR
ncbi:MAG: hypothetical protein H8D74_00290 [Chloroflexi bacterium]|nr:hypothetical protein [Chloroflexota bacterium]